MILFPVQVATLPISIHTHNPIEAATSDEDEAISNVSVNLFIYPPTRSTYLYLPQGLKVIGGVAGVNYRLPFSPN